MKIFIELIPYIPQIPIDKDIIESIIDIIDGLTINTIAIPIIPNKIYKIYATCNPIFDFQHIQNGHLYCSSSVSRFGCL